MAGGVGRGRGGDGGAGEEGVDSEAGRGSVTRSVSAKGKSGFPRNSDGSIFMVGDEPGTPDRGHNEESSSTSRRRGDAAGHRHAEPGVRQEVYSESSASSAPAKELVDPGRQRRGGEGMGGGSDAEYESMDFEEEGLEELLV